MKLTRIVNKRPIDYRDDERVYCGNRVDNPVDGMQATLPGNMDVPFWNKRENKDIVRCR